MNRILLEDNYDNSFLGMLNTNLTADEVQTQINDIKDANPNFTFYDVMEQLVAQNEDVEFITFDFLPSVEV